jgi:hypothetical protein
MNYRRKYKVITWSSYRKIPDYEKTIEDIASRRAEILLFIAEVLMPSPDLEAAKIEVAELAGKLSIPFDDALYYRWNYCQKLYDATERIKAVHSGRNSS